MSDPFGDLMKQTDAVVRILRRLANELERVKNEEDFIPKIERDKIRGGNNLGLYHEYSDTLKLSLWTYDNAYYLTIFNPCSDGSCKVYVEGTFEN